MSAAKIAALYTALGLRLDPMRRKWDAMRAGERRVLLLAARLHSELETRAWDAIKPENQGRIAAAYGRMVGWVAKVENGERLAA